MADSVTTNKGRKEDVQKDCHSGPGEGENGLPSVLMPNADVRSYHLVREIGRGGMGTVYLASRPDLPIKVALKMLSSDSAALSKRFRREQQILASLEHPNIARFLDSGTTEAGNPFLVMEYVAGVNLKQYVTARGLTLKEKLEVFLKICQTVSFAHQRLVIHRDLKPENIMITSEGEPKLLDFGIASLLDPDTLTPDTVTRKENIMTPAYASPEQILDQPLTVATDIYSLGVVLFELLTGKVPKRKLANLTEDRLYDFDINAVKTMSKKGNVQLARELRGDLEAILFKALRGDPGERYASVEQLARDIGAYLYGFPVQARTPSTFYRLSKFFRRYRFQTAVVSMAFLLVSLFAGLAFNERQSALKERDRARLEQRTAETMVQFMENLFAEAKRDGASEQVTVKTVLDQGAKRIVQEFGNETEIRVRLLNAISKAYLQMGYFSNGISLIEEAIETQRSETASDSLVLARLHMTAGSLYADGGSLQKGEKHFRKAIDLLHEMPGQDHLHAKIYKHLGGILKHSGRYQEAEQFLLQSYVIRLSRSGLLHRETIQVMDALGLLYYRWGKIPDAEHWLRRGEEVAGKIPDFKSPSTSNNLALVLVHQNRHEEAAQRFEEIVLYDTQTFGAEHPHTATSLSNLALSYKELGRYTEAETYLKRALVIKRKAYGEEHPSLADSLAVLADLYIKTEDYEKAEDFARQAMEMDLSYLEKNDPYLVSDYLRLARIKRLRNVPEEALIHARNALDLVRRLESDKPELFVLSLIEIGKSQVLLKEPEQGLSALARAWKMLPTLSSEQLERFKKRGLQELLQDLCSQNINPDLCADLNPGILN